MDFVEENYEIIKLIGSGAYGSVSLAKRKLDGKLIALKIIKTKNDKKLNAAIEEIKALEKVSKFPECNKYISCLDAGFVDDINKIVYIEMEYIDGPNLEEYVKPFIEAGDGEALKNISLKVINAITQALQVVHENGLLHNDIKPANIVIEKNTMIPKLVDFGLSCITSPAIACKIDDKEFGRCCEGGGGSFSFVAPELIISFKRFYASDIWSLGATIYSILTGASIWNRGIPYKDMKIPTIKIIVRSGREAEEIESPWEELNVVVNGMTRRNINNRLTSKQILRLLY